MLNLDSHFFPIFDRLDAATAYPGTYNFGLVATSVAIAILAAFVAFSISGHIAAATTRWGRYAWASAGAISMGWRHLVDALCRHAGVLAALRDRL
jgi:NO-binding membrane sensor protein with MHYT domain